MERMTASEKKEKSVKSAYQRRKLKECLDIILQSPVKKESVKRLLKEYGLTELDGLQNDLALMLIVFQKGLNGDLKSIEFIRDTIGEAPTNNVNANVNVEGGGNVRLLFDYGDNKKDDDEE